MKMDWDNMLLMAVGHMKLSPEVFWNLTFHEFNLMVKGYNDRMEMENKQLISNAWHTAVFQRQKKLKPLKMLLANRETKVLEGEELERRRAEFEELTKKLKKI